MTLKELLEKWNKVREALQKEQHMDPKQIPTVSNMLDAAKDNGFFMNLESILESFMKKHPETRTYMVQTGLLEADDEKSWTKLNDDWMSQSQTLYNADIKRRQALKAEQLAKDNIKNFDEKTIQDLLSIYSSMNPLYAHAIRKLNAQQEYYQDYDNLTKEQKAKINSNEIPELIDTYYAEAGDPKLQDFINKRVERLMNMEKAFAEASKKALEGDQKPYYGTLEKDEAAHNICIPGMRYKHPGLQSTTQGCWSVALSTLLKQRGIDVSQNDLRQFKPADNPDLANKDSGQALSTYAPLIHKLLPNTMVCTAQQEVAVDVNEKDPKKLRKARSDAKDTLNKLIQCGLEMSQSPIGLWINGHYRVVYGVDDSKYDGYGYSAEYVDLYDPYSNSNARTSFDDLIEKNLNNGKCTFSVDWIQEFKVNEDKTLSDLPGNKGEAVKSDPDLKFYTFQSDYGFDVTADMPNQVYNEAELKKLREEAAGKLEQFRELDEKLKRWDENTKKSISNYENERKKDPLLNNNVEEADDLGGIEETLKQLEQLNTSIKENDKLLTDIANALKDIPNDNDLEQAKTILPPKKIEELRAQKPQTIKKLNDIQNKLTESQKSLNARMENKGKRYQNMLREAYQKEQERLQRLENNKKARQEIFDNYMAIKDTSDYGRKSHDTFHRMVDALRDYKLTHNEELKSSEEQKHAAAKALHDACAAYLEKHIVKDKNGTTKIGGQTYETGAMRKQAAVQIMELLEDLPEYQQAVQKEQDDLVIQEEIAPQKKGKEVKKEKINFNQLKDELKSSLSRHTKNKQVAPGKEAAYADLEAAKAKNRNQNKLGG